jgi:hypothetical protein
MASRDSLAVKLDAAVATAAAILQLKVEVPVLFSRAEEIVVSLGHVGSPRDERPVLDTPDRRVALPAIEGATVEKRPQASVGRETDE